MPNESPASSPVRGRDLEDEQSLGCSLLGASTMDLAEVLDSVAKKMRIDFEDTASSIGHTVRKGFAREALIVQSYLSKYLPGSVRAIAGAEIVTSDGQVSPEVDVAVVDPLTPPLYEAANGYQVLPVECVYGMLEIKGKL